MLLLSKSNNEEKSIVLGDIILPLATMDGFISATLVLTPLFYIDLQQP
jgi:hypothetical protein